jgi:hypothetical protein
MSRTISSFGRFGVAGLVAWCAGQALGQVGTLPPVVGGLVHVPEGDTIVEGVSYAVHSGGSATLSSASSSVQFHIDWPVAADGSGSVGTFEMLSLDPPVPGAFAMTTAVCSVGGVEFGRCIERETGVERVCDFAMQGASVCEWRALSSSGEVLASGVVSGSSVRMVRSVYPPGTPGVQASSGGGAGKATFSDLSIMKRVSDAPAITVHGPGGPVVVSGAEYFSVHRIVCITSPCPGDGLGPVSVQVSSTRRRVEVLKSNRSLSQEASSLLSGPPSPVSVHATEGALMQSCEACDYDSDGDGTADTDAIVLQESSSGASLSPPALVFSHSAPVSSVSFRKQYVGHVTLLKRTASTGASSRCITSENPATGEISLTPDFSSIAGGECDLVAYDVHGTQLGTASICVGCTVVLNPDVLCPPPSYPKWLIIGPHKIFQGCQDIYNLVLPGGSVIPGVHSVRLTPSSNAAMLSDISSVSIEKLAGPSDVMVGSYRIVPSDAPPACDSIDFNTDGLFPDDADLLDFLSVLAGGECSTGACNDIDFNNDGLFPDDTDLLAFLSVLAGQSCD